MRAKKKGVDPWPWSGVALFDLNNGVCVHKSSAGPDGPPVLRRVSVCVFAGRTILTGV